MSKTRQHRRMISITATSLMVLVGSILGIVGAELGAQAYVYFIAKKEKRFQPDERLGWILLPNLAITRKNADGDLYLIETNKDSIRGPSQFPDEPSIRRLLVLGDSFAFGEGVDLEDRFDHFLVAQVPELAVVNIGVPGYGTDQQIIRARDYLPMLRNGDVLLILLYGNDFSDVARKRHSARSKPWFDFDHGKLVEHVPNISWVEKLRDKSYIFSVIAGKLDIDETYEMRLPYSGKLIKAILADFSDTLRVRGVELWIAFHGIDQFALPFDPKEIMNDICSDSLRCINLAPILADRGELLQSDGHWNAHGHSQVGAALAKTLFVNDGYRE